MPESPLSAAALPYFVVDVFTDEPYAGNPLAVVLDADDLSTPQLQALAREFNLSETAFPMAAEGGGADYRLRIFTPTVELPFAGHPSVGAAWLLATLGRVAPGHVVQRCGAGDLPLRIAPDGGPVALTGGSPEVSEDLDPASYAAGVGVPAGAVVGPVRAAGTGLRWAYVRLASPAAVDASLGDSGAMRELEHPTVYAFSWDATTSTAYARGWAGGVGIDEDPATGSAALGLGAYLVATGDLPADGTSAYTVRQGVAMGRPSTLRATVEARDGVAVRCVVEGDCVLVASGHITPPR